MAKFGLKTFFGDAARPELLHAAGLHEADMLIIAIDDPARTLEITEYARKERPDIHIVARASDRLAVFKLFQAGANDIIRETFDSSVRAGRSALEALGAHPFEAEKMVSAFVARDLRAMRQLAEVYDPNVSAYENEAYVSLSKSISEDTIQAIARSRAANKGAIDRAWRPPGPTGENEASER